MSRQAFVESAKFEYVNIQNVTDRVERAHLSCELAIHKFDNATHRWYQNLNKTGFTRLINEVSGFHEPKKRESGKKYQFYVSDKNTRISKNESIGLSIARFKRYNTDFEVCTYQCTDSEIRNWVSTIANSTLIQTADSKISGIVAINGKSINEIAVVVKNGKITICITIR